MRNKINIDWDWVGEKAVTLLGIAASVVGAWVTTQQIKSEVKKEISEALPDREEDDDEEEES